MRARHRFGAIVLASSLALSASAVVQADDTPGAQQTGAAAVNMAQLNVEGMT